eukprot:TRINITY_DN9018_c0_g1_i1.p1 TRINITY_DN9018_c0_g1~~TRINITY_DN9018_c0_g1_i1.p1  ORF type:complete len:393 (+),score=42.67 TRINITY_DN9018_c0_g1_i1:67-1245(+)
MSIRLAFQVGRDEAHFTPIPPFETLDKVYDARPVKQRIPAVYFDRTLGRGTDMVVEDQRPQYNPKYSLVHPRAPSFKIARSGLRKQAADTEEETPEARSASEAHSPREAADAAFFRRGLAFAKGLGRDAPVIGMPLPSDSPSASPPPDTDIMYASLRSRPPGGKLPQARLRRIAAVPKLGVPDTYLSPKTLLALRPRTPGVDLRRMAGRDHTTDLQRNRVQLAALLRGVGRDSGTGPPSGGAPSSLLGQQRSRDMSLVPGRESPVHDRVPTDRFAVQGAVADVAAHTRHVQRTVCQPPSPSPPQRRSRGVPSKLDLRWPRGQNALFRDTFLSRLRDDLAVVDAKSINMGASLYRVQLRHTLQSSSREEVARQATTRVGALLEAPDGDDLEDF